MARRKENNMAITTHGGTTDAADKTGGASDIASSDLFGAGSFVFLDDRPWPFMVNKTTDGWWLYYWSEGQKNFVTMRSLTEQEVERFRAHALPPEQAKHYRIVAENNWPKFKAPNDES